jgi:sortase B
MPLGVLITLVSIAAVLCIALVVLMVLDNHGMLGGAGNGTSAEEEQYVNDQDGGGTENGEDDVELRMAGDTTGLVFPDFDKSLYMSDSAFAAVDPKHDAVDIGKLQKEINPEIYAWIYIPQTGIDYPILQHADKADEAFYATHNEKGEEDPKGAINTEYYNLKEFKDYLTIAYGTNHGDGTMFSNLDFYRDPEFFKSQPYIYVYTEDKLLVYKTFAEYEFESTHIILYYAPTVDWLYESYLEKLENFPGIDANVDKDAWPDKNDRILTLSTHIKDKDDKRFLVQATLYGIRELDTDKQ